jgi:hypothetical protein
VIVPPVPTPAVKASSRPSRSFEISSAIVCRCASGFAGFSNSGACTSRSRWRAGLPGRRRRACRPRRVGGRCARRRQR